MYNSSGSSAVLIIALVWMLIGLGLLVWYLWAMARLFPRIGLKSTDGWIPIWNQWKLLERVGLPGWVVLLSFVGLSIVPFVMLIIAMHRLGKEYRAGVGYTVLGAFIAPLWATLFANHVGEGAAKPAAASYTNYAANGATAGGYSAAVQPGFVPPPAPPAQPTAFAAAGAPAAPPVVPAAPPAPPAPPAPAFAPQAQQPWAAASGAGAPAAPGAGAGATPFSAPLGRDTEAEYDRLASEGFHAPPATPLGQNNAPSPFSWTAARAEQEQARSEQVVPAPVIPPVHPLAAAQAPVPPAAPASVNPGAEVAPPAPSVPPAPPAPAAPPAPPAPTAAQLAAAAPPAVPSVPPAQPAPPAPPVVPPAPPVTEAVAVPLPPAAAPAVQAPAQVTPQPTPAPTPAPAVQKATGITGMIDPLPANPVASAAHAGEADPHDDLMDLDHTVVAPRRSAPSWVLELPDGTQLPLPNNVVVGRKPDAVEGSEILAIPDRTRTLSKSHARLVYEGGRWLVEDLGSTNGLVLLNEDGTESELSPGVRVEATERMLFGTLEVLLRPGGEAA